jgi:DNA-binding NarL/FixJ family response regulator
VSAEPTVVVASQDVGLLRTIRRVGTTTELKVLDELTDASAVVDTARQQRPDAVLLDIDLPEGGVETVQQITVLAPSVLTVVVGDTPTDDQLFGALYAGASGYMPRDLTSDQWRTALRSLLDGEALLPRTLTSRLVEEFRARERHKRLLLRGRPGVDLTSREWTILQHIERDLTTNDIAERLFVSPVTVRTHVSAIMRKLDVPNRQALRRVLRER